jgi:hypothetical protein
MGGYGGGNPYQMQNPFMGGGGMGGYGGGMGGYGGGMGGYGGGMGGGMGGYGGQQMQNPFMGGGMGGYGGQQMQNPFMGGQQGGMGGFGGMTSSNVYNPSNGMLGMGAGGPAPMGGGFGSGMMADGQTIGGNFGGQSQTQTFGTLPMQAPKPPDNQGDQLSSTQGGPMGYQGGAI